MSTPTLPPLRDPAAFVERMERVARTLADDLGKRARDPRVDPSLRETWAAEQKAGQTGEAFEAWRDAFCDQVAASWVLCTVFVRTLEDRGFLPHRIAGPGAEDRKARFRAQFRFLGDREYLQHIFDALAEPPPSWPADRPGNAWVGAQVFGKAAPLWRLSPSSQALTALLDALRATDASKELLFTFGRPEGVEHDGSTTRFLGDLYQDLNEAVRKRYALLQTPDFVERFILDQTLTPAMAERGSAVTVCDPACGSGHFLLGAFDRLFDARLRQAPGTNKAEAAKAALSQVYGIDLNPYAAAIAKFRLVVSYLDKAGLTSLEQFPSDLQLHVYVGDALLSGKEIQGELGEVAKDAAFGNARGFSLLDETTDKLLRKTRFDVVVGNPPYITEKDATKRELIRRNYKAAAGKYALSAPFVERLFELANEGGWSGQITSNSFMKREFGKAVIEEVLAGVDVNAVVDTSGAYIPGHGTPTVLLFGRAQPPTRSTVQVVRSIRGEPRTPPVPADGLVWSDITRVFGQESAETPLVSASFEPRHRLATHPWILRGGGAIDLLEHLHSRYPRTIGDYAPAVGITCVTGENEVFSRPESHLKAVDSTLVKRLVEGDEIRDWAVRSGGRCIFPATSDFKVVPEERLGQARHLMWPYKQVLARRKRFGTPMVERGMAWYELQEVYPDKLNRPTVIVYGEVATHSHFAVSSESMIFNRTAPVIRLPDEASVGDHHRLTALLNSSLGCFLFKMYGFNKGDSTDSEGARTTGESYFDTYQCGGTAIGRFPLPAVGPRAVALSEQISAKAEFRATSEPRAVISAWSAAGSKGLADSLKSARNVFESTARQMVALQEELDWTIYRSLGFVAEDMGWAEVGAMAPEHRPFEISLADLASSGVDSGAWFVRHERAPCTVASIADRALAGRVRQALAITGSPSGQFVRLLEHPDFKRRWEPFDWDAAVTDAGRAHLLDAAERHFESLRSPSPRPLTARDVAHALSTDPKNLAVAEVLHGSPGFDFDALLGALMLDEAVPSATSQLYSDTGIETRRLWERTWALQRREDAGEKVSIDVPPKYEQDDFQNKGAVWRHRGKLDVPKERFIAYPTATPPPGANDKAGRTFGWAGWNHLEQLQAVIALWQDEWAEHGQKLVPRATRAEREEALGQAAGGDAALEADAEAREKLLPLLQTMADLLPWVRQWHNEDGETAAQFEGYVTEECRKVEMSGEEVLLWRAAKKEKRGRTPRGAKAKEPAVAVGEEAVLEAIRAAGEAGIELEALAEAVGVAKAKLKGPVDALVAAGRVVEVKKRPRVVRVAGLA